MFAWYASGIILLAVILLSLYASNKVNSVTLALEFNASKRALDILKEEQILADEEMMPARKVLQAAALTYIAAPAVALLNLIRLIMIFGGGRDD